MAMTPLSSEHWSDINQYGLGKTYTKYSDGTLICTNLFALNLSINVATHNMYITNVTDFGDTPGNWAYPFSQLFSTSIDTISASYFSWICEHSGVSLLRCGTFRLASSYIRSTGEYKICITGIGRWD